MAKDAVGGRVLVVAGEYMIYRTKMGQRRSQHGNWMDLGAWFKARSDESVDYDNPTLTKVQEEVSYDEREGARDGTFKHSIVKRFYQDARRSPEVTEETEAAMHAEHLKGQLVDAAA